MDPNDPPHIDNSIQIQLSSQQSSSLPSIIQPKQPHCKISQDRIILDDSTSQNLLTSVICPICLMVLPVPYYLCECCDNTFCIECLEDWLKKQPETCIFKCQKANFKLVKRSNTYNALMDLLCVKCQLCEYKVQISQLQHHLDQLCKKKMVGCKNQGCEYRMTRESLALHEENCEHRVVICEDCKDKVKVGEFVLHCEELCVEKQKRCVNEECNILVKVNLFKSHIKECPYRKLVCSWCKKSMYLEDNQNHQNTCEQRLSQCQWCKTVIQVIYIPDHMFQCQLREQLCELCQSSIRSNWRNQHIILCMFKQMCTMKKSLRSYEEENIHLKMKVKQLQELLHDQIENRESKMLRTINNVREKQKVQIRKDLLRVQNSIKSIQRMRKQQVDTHMKMPHISSSLCYFCSNLKKKYKDLMQPMQIKRQQIRKKLQQIDRYQQTLR